MIKFLKKINHMETHICVTAEREVLKILEGDCETAVGAISKKKKKKKKIEGNNIYISAIRTFFY